MDELGDPRGELNILLTGNREVRELNRKYRGKDKPTDVLSFPAGDNTAKGKSRMEITLGDIAISLPYAKKQAAGIGNSYEREVLFLMVHGLLHILGYEHEGSAAKEKKMTAMQKRLMAVGYGD